MKQSVGVTITQAVNNILIGLECRSLIFSACLLFIDLYSLFIFPVICVSLSSFLNKPICGGFILQIPPGEMF